jgi:hypothetical protein
MAGEELKKLVDALGLVGYELESFQQYSHGLLQLNVVKKPAAFPK